MTLSAAEQRLRENIAARDSRLRAELAQHIAVPTGHNFTQGLDQYRDLLADRLKALGATIEVVPGIPRPNWLDLPSEKSASSNAIPPTLIARNAKNSNAKRILIAGHLDTVYDPHCSFREITVAPDGRTAVGPGVVDMKGGILIAMHALEALAECGIALNWTVLLNSDEETGSFHSYDAIFQAAKQHDVGLALEPALPDGSLVVERMGAGQFKIEVFGKSAHVGRDFTRGISAVNRLCEIVAEIAKISDPTNGLIVSVGPLEGGKATNVVPDHAACWGNMRFSKPQAAELLQKKLAAFASQADSLPRVVVRQTINRPVKLLTESVRTLADSARRAAEDLGQQLHFGSTGGVCDGNIMQHAGLPTIDTLGVRGGNLHRTDEFIELASLVERCQLLAVLIARLSAA
jgi:glutamate carboxypeptidase